MLIVVNHPFFQNQNMNQESLKKIVESTNSIENELKSLKEMSQENKEEIFLTWRVLLRGIFEATEVDIPTTFVILSEMLPENYETEKKKMMKLELKDNGSGFKAVGDLADAVETAKTRYEKGMELVDRLLTFIDGIKRGDSKCFRPCVGVFQRFNHKRDNVFLSH